MQDYDHAARAPRRRPQTVCRRVIAPRRGITSVLAMLYMIIFSALALGFYATIHVSSQVTSNDRRAAEAQAAADSGLQFVRYHLNKITIPSTVKYDAVFEELYMSLAGNIEGSTNLGVRILGYDPGRPSAVPAVPPRISIPDGANEFVDIGNGMAFRATLTKAGKKLLVKVIGRSGTTTSGARAFEITFKNVERNNSVFGYGIASPGQVVIDSTGIIQGTPTAQANILSTYQGANPITIGTGNATNPGGTVGTLTTITGYDPVLRAGVSVGGTTNQAVIRSTHVRKLAPAAAPEWPVADTSELKRYATQPYVPGNTVYENILIRANTVPAPTFSNGMTVRGLVFIEQPNVVNFNGNVTVQALVVTEDRGVGNVTTPTNHVQFAGNGGAKLPLEGLFALDAKYEFLREYVGSFIIAPGFAVTMTGNFGSITGNIAADKVTITGNADASVAGSVVALKAYPLQIGGSTRLTMNPIAGTPHVGLRFKHFYAPESNSYLEVRP